MKYRMVMRMPRRDDSSSRIVQRRRVVFEIEADSRAHASAVAVDMIEALYQFWRNREELEQICIGVDNGSESVT